MAFLVAEAGAWTLKKILPWALLAAAVLLLGGALWVQSARLGAAKTEIKTLTERADTLHQDVDRWQKSAGSMQRVIDDQAAELTQHRADAVKAQAIADATAESQAQEISSLTNQIQSMKERARVHPDQVRPLGPIVLDVLASMQREAGPAPAAPASH